MNLEHPIAIGYAAMPSARRRLMDLIQHVTGCDRSTAGSVVADTIHQGEFTAETVALYEHAQAQAKGDAVPCPRCMGVRPHGTSGICRNCRQAMAERARARDAGRAPAKAIRLAGLPEPTFPLPEPTAPPDPRGAPGGASRARARRDRRRVVDRGGPRPLPALRRRAGPSHNEDAMSRSDDNLAAAIAASLRASYQAELDARANPPPPRPTGPVPDWLFGPRHRAMDAIRTAARDAARSIVVEPEVLPDLAPPSVAAPAEHCPWCRQPMPDGEP